MMSHTTPSLAAAAAAGAAEGHDLGPLLVHLHHHHPLLPLLHHVPGCCSTAYVLTLRAAALDRLLLDLMRLVFALLPAAPVRHAQLAVQHLLMLPLLLQSLALHHPLHLRQQQQQQQDAQLQQRDVQQQHQRLLA
jgi:hypothetical protein